SRSSCTTGRELYAGSSRSVKYSLVSSGARLSRLSTRGSERCRTACPAAKLAVSPSAASARPTRPALARPRPTAETRLGECRLRLVVSDDVARLEPEQIVVHEHHSVELAEVVNGYHTEHEPVAGHGVDPALEADRVEQLALVSLRGLPRAVFHPAGVDVGRRRRAVLARP